jgi:CDP-diacylglycerol--serine O-phosphatidyltransferase
MPRAPISAADVLTVMNGICGFLALTILAGVWLVEPGPGLEHRELVACLLLYGIGMTCDVLDGPVARRFGSSGLGPGLDTICDTITFGILPAMLLLARLGEDDAWTVPALAVACGYVGATIVRLVRQVALEQTLRDAVTYGGAEPGPPTFRGMPSPAGGNCVLAIVVLAPAPAISVAVVALVAVLLVADYTYPSNKTLVGAAFVAGLLAASFAAIAGLISLDVPSAVALAGLLPIAVARAVRSLVNGR